MDGQQQGPGIEELKRNLQHQLTLYKRLLDLIREEKTLLITGDAKAIRESTFSKEALIDEVFREEFRRQKWLKSAALFYKKEAGELTLEAIANLEGADHYQDLMSLRQTLQMFLKKVQELNYENKKLAQSAIKEMHEMKKNILGLVSDTPKVYGPKGHMGKGKDAAGTLVSQEA